MLPGFGGYLISEFFLESHLRSHNADANTISTTQARSRLEQWRRHCRSLGPSSSVRALLETAAVPLVEALGFEAPRRVQGHHATPSHDSEQPIKAVISHPIMPHCSP